MDKEKLLKRGIEESTLNIMGFEVLIIKREIGKEELSFFCAYVELKNVIFFSDTFLGHPTYRDKDVIGIDTAHGYNDKMTELEKI